MTNIGQWPVVTISPTSPSRTGCSSWLRRGLRQLLVESGFSSRTTSTVDPPDLPPGEPPPSPPPAPPDGSNSEARQRNEVGKRSKVAAAGGGGSKRRAADDGAAGPSGSTAKKAQLVPSEDDNSAEEAAAPAAAAAAPAAAEAEVAADESITPEAGLDALRGAVELFELKSKPEYLPFPPLIAATRATDFGSALTASTSREGIVGGCKSLASKLGSLDNLDDAQEEKRDKLVLMLQWPSAALLGAFAKELRAGEGGAAGGEAAQAAEALLATRRVEVARFVIKQTEATGESACAKMKELFRHIRTEYHNVLT